MLAVVGLSAEETGELVASLSSRFYLHLANHNSRTQCVVSGAFHTTAFAAAKEAVERELAGMNLRDPSIPLISGYTGTELKDAAAVTRALGAGITSPVLWCRVQEELVRRGAGPQVEVGPGKVLNNMAGRDHPRLFLLHASDLLPEGD